MEEARSVLQTKDGGYLVLGNTTSKDGNLTGLHNGGFHSPWVLKLDSEGKIEWTKTLGRDSFYINANSILQTSNGYIISGTISLRDSTTTHYKENGVLLSRRIFDYPVKFWIAKLDEKGDIVYQYTIQGDYSSISNVMRQTNDNGFVIAGNATSFKKDFYSDTASLNYRSYILLVKINEDGIVEWEKEISDTSRVKFRSFLLVF